VANRPKDNRAEQKNAPNSKLVKPAEGGIHSAVGTGVARQGAVGQNENPNTQEQTNQD
jgi:hypothetical protein